MPAPNLKVNAKSVVILVAVAVMLLAANLAVYVMSSGSLNEAKSQLKSREDQVENSKRVAARLENSERAYAEVADRLKTLERSVSRADYVPTLLKQLENTGKTVRLDIVGVKPVVKKDEGPSATRSAGQTDPNESSPKPATAAAKKETPKPYDDLQIDIQVQGTYWNTLRFLDELTRFPKIVAVNSVQITPNGESLRDFTERRGRGKYSPGLNVTLGVSAYVFPKEKDILPNVTTSLAPTVTIEPVPPVRSRAPIRVGEKKWRSGHEAG